MPFIENSKRPLVRDNPMLHMKQPGDRCYIIYAEMVRRWRNEPRWTTADAIHAEFVMDTEDNRFLEDLYSKAPTTGWHELCNASSLAWQVFFQLYVMPYEEKKRKENGDI